MIVRHSPLTKAQVDAVRVKYDMVQRIDGTWFIPPHHISISILAYMITHDGWPERNVEIGSYRAKQC